MADQTADELYTEESINGNLTNRFRSDVNRRTIQVTKTWAGRSGLPEAENKYPSVTYRLYRYEYWTEDGVQKTSAPVLLRTAKINANEFAKAADGTYTYSFTDLLICSPNGRYYGYYITENSINGYTVSYRDEAEIPDGYQDNNRSDIVSQPDIKTRSTVQVGTTNTYQNTRDMRLIGTKRWDDYGKSELIYGKRPENITITLKRHTGSEAYQGNQVLEEDVTLLSVPTEGEPYIQWEKGTTDAPNVWTYTIHNLERYAPNGMPYVYTVTEQAVAGYNQQTRTVSGEAPANGNLKLSAFVNNFGKSYTVRKNWMDGNNKYGLRPTSVTVVLQRSKDGGETWQNIPWEDTFGVYYEKTRRWTGLPSAAKADDGSDIVSIRLTADYVVPNTKGNSWQYTFTNLPEQDTDGTAWKYRCIETKIGNAVFDETKTLDGKNQVGAYTRSYPTQDEGKTVIQNKLESTSLHVTCEWEGDNGNLYRSRPESLSFILQKRGVQLDENGNVVQEIGWQDVKVQGNDTFTMKPNAAGNWEMTLQDLPVAMMDDNGKIFYSLYFRAIAVHTDDTTDAGGNTVPGKMPVGALNYEDQTDYVNGTNHYYDKDASRNESIIKNLLISDTNVTVNKVWYRQPGEQVTATFELMYRVEGNTGWLCYGGKGLPADGNWNGHTADGGCLLKTMTSTGPGNDQQIWPLVPKFNREGQVLEYTVVEHPLPGYDFDGGADRQQAQPSAFQAVLNLFRTAKTAPDAYEAANSFAYTNIELQDYRVQKVWQTTDYAQKAPDGTYTATFRLEQKVGTADWTPVEGRDPISLTAAYADIASGKEISGSWTALPKYLPDGTEVTYRGVEININGVDVHRVETAVDTNDAYIVTYKYGGAEEPAFANTLTVATNRMVYGFVNLSKKAAYLAANGIAEGGSLAGVQFDIYSGTGNDKTLYASGITTDASGNLTRNADGTYGTEHKHLISGTYTLMETVSSPGYSVWKDGVTFTVGVSGSGNTGEHGTAWISTSQIGSWVWRLKVEYKGFNGSSHPDYLDDCSPETAQDPAYNLESRGVIAFTKTGPQKADGTYTQLDTHTAASGESEAYFGVYLEEACITQVAGMTAPDITHFLLTNLAQDKSELTVEVEGVPYLRQYGSQYTLLSGTYYIRELTAPPGYKLDGTVRKAVIPPVKTPVSKDENSETELLNTFLNNKATIGPVREEQGSTAYNWPNEPNQLTLYKRDQYGRAVTLKDAVDGKKGWLELTVQGDGNTFPTGSATILLRQGEGIAPYVTYDGDHWTITGLFDIGRTYTIREPVESVPDSHIQAKDFSFTMNADGSIAYVPAAGLTSTDKPLEEDGRSYENAFCANADCNVVVMRDVARFLTDVTLKKVIAGSNQPIPNISFRLYKYSTVDGQGNPTDAQPVLTNASPRDYLTTDETGQIVLSGQPDGYGNQITGCKLKYGLDMGSYFFEEMERGASDQYRLVGRVFFTIEANNPENTNPTTQQDYENYARVVFGNGFGRPASSGKTGIVENRQVPAKTLQLTKKNEAGEPLSGAKFTLTYQSINHGQTGAQPQETISCATGEGGALYRLDANGTLTSAKPDISRKGTYTLVETQAPEYYMTPTENGKLPVLLRFRVESDHSVTVLQKHALVTIDLKGADILDVFVTNKRTAIAIAKRNDMENDTKTGDQKRLLGEPLPGARLELYEGVYDPAKTPVANGTGISDANGNWSLAPGTLKENTLYTLHESQAPVGYLEAKDIYFKLFGTTTVGEGENQRVVSTLSVWNGTGNPDVDAEGWSQDNIRDAMLTMVDETIVVPVDLRKVLDQNGTYSNLPGARFEIGSLDDNSVLGTAVTDQAGHLVWEEVTNSNELVFESGRRLTTDNAGSAKGKAIFLGQNSGGYQLTESYAPDTVYNNGGSYTVNLTAQNFRDYLADTSRKLNAVNGSMETVANGFAAEEGTVVNLPYESTVTLHKYDLEDDTIAIAGAQFTLYHATVDGEDWTRGEAVTDAIAPGGDNGVFTTDPEGNLSIEIHRKGTYMLVETAAVPGYKLDGQNPPTFRITLTDAEYKKTLPVKDPGVPNEKIHLTVTKVDSETGDKLPGVAFTLRPAEGSHFLESYVNSHPDDFSDGAFTLETGEDGTARIPGGLVQQGHSYILTETGLGPNTTYRLAAEETGRQITFRVNEDGTMEITPNWMFRLADGDKTNLIVANEKIRLTVSKLDQATGSGVAGAVLTLSRDGQVQGTLTTTDALHSLTFTNLTPGSYQLAETTPPNGYNPITDPLVFDIDQSGKVTAAYIHAETDVSLAPAEGYALAGENFTISNPKDGETGGIELKVRNARYSDLQITKQGSDGATLQSVVFRLDKADGTLIGQETTNQEGVAAFTNLPDGDYLLTELKTAPGYNLLSVPLEIHIDRNSEIYRVTSNGTVISGSGLVRNGNTIEMTVINQKGLALPATGTTTPELPKAVLLMTAALEGLVLYFYQTHGKRRKKEN